MMRRILNLFRKRSPEEVAQDVLRELLANLDQVR